MPHRLRKVGLLMSGTDAGPTGATERMIEDPRTLQHVIERPRGAAEPAASAAGYVGGEGSFAVTTCDVPMVGVDGGR
jgi:hypothetical protein